jgi:hypothetical protein
MQKSYFYFELNMNIFILSNLYEFHSMQIFFNSLKDILKFFEFQNLIVE